MARWVIAGVGLVVAAVLGPAGNAMAQSREPTVRWIIDESVFDLTLWQSVQGSRDPQDYRIYLEQFPNGRFAALARNRLRALAAATPPPVESAVEPIELGSVAPSAPAAAPARARYDGVWRGRSGPWVVDVTVRDGDVDGTLRCGNNIYRLRERL